ncbi:deoxynucleoside kinase [Bacillus sp. Au-Bac7]|uniref:deoxynucleoside kinase n=1 Tax=Bacillus sp. Au-Bac7 TaxID=2906458 RepID=UPI001E494AB8|nr:deoxynucleoside kinase [Bacillus sp. Au-Bac7]MCE4052164.1 deoxynucleoside kinase [Bacillus sp. Au-Bac7]
MNNIPFITVEGPIGVGKTSLAKLLSEHFQYHLLKEIVEENPFLGKFYENIDEWSFQTEMFFLCNRYKQLNDIQSHYLDKNIPVVADYHILKNLIFAKRTLQEKELTKYIRIYDVLTEDLPAPNIIIYLHASLDTLMDRIQQRDRDIEKNISPLYLEQLSSDYHEVMEQYQEQHPHIPVLSFNGDTLDFVKNKADLETIIDKVKQTLKLGAYTHEPTHEI